MNRYQLAADAAADLLEIVRYTRKKWGQAQAQRYREELDLGLQQLCLAPGRGRSRDAIAPDLRSFPVAHHVAFYVQRKGKVIILRIVHPRMNVAAVFEEGQ